MYFGLVKATTNLLHVRLLRTGTPEAFLSITLGQGFVQRKSNKYFCAGINILAKLRFSQQEVCVHAELQVAESI